MSKIEPCSRLSSAELKTESMLPRCLSWVEEREQRTEDVQVCSEMLRNVLDHDCHDHLYHCRSDPDHHKQRNRAVGWWRMVAERRLLVAAEKERKER